MIAIRLRRHDVRGGGRFRRQRDKDAIGLSVDNLQVSGAISSGRWKKRISPLASTTMRASRFSAPTGTSLRSISSCALAALARFAATARRFQPRSVASRIISNSPKDASSNTVTTPMLETSVVASRSNSPRFAGRVNLEARNARHFAVAGLCIRRGLVHARPSHLHFRCATDQAIEVKVHAIIGSDVMIELWSPARLPLAIGQTFTVTAGCDKHLSTCIGKFNDAVNFRGFAHMPGNDYITSQQRIEMKSNRCRLKRERPTAEDVVRVARNWIGTPYHHQASLRGVDTDCLGLVREIWRDLYQREAEMPPR